MQNLEPVLRACPELQKLNLASCALLGENALDALLPAGSGASHSPSFTQVNSPLEAHVVFPPEEYAGPADVHTVLAA